MDTKGLIRYWLGFIHGCALVFCIAWTYEGKMSGVTPLPLVWAPVVVITLAMLFATIGNAREK
jgi:hypothetical protein